MKLKLSENIKKYRKEMNLTQEGLAEAFGVTVGAVSKWESGSTVPDILTMMELADFFNVSMDILLGYNISSKTIEDISGRIIRLAENQQYTEAVSEAEKALVRYPVSFKIVRACAFLYAILYRVNQKEEDAKKSVALHEKALTLLSQNDDSDFNEFNIRMNIAKLKIVIDPDGALAEFNKINYLGIADTDIARLLHKKGETDEALERYTKALFYNLMRDLDLSLNMSLAIASRGTKKDFIEACDLIDRSIAYSDSASFGKNSYTSRLKAILLITKALALSCLTEYESMKSTIDEAYALAKKYDDNPNNSFRNFIKFWHAKEDFKPLASDDLGQSAVRSIDNFFETKPYTVQKKFEENIFEAKKYWESIRTKKEVE